jgi:hypothetical protein
MAEWKAWRDPEKLFRYDALLSGFGAKASMQSHQV